jgi:hypothetical protein
VKKHVGKLRKDYQWKRKRSRAEACFSNVKMSHLTAE